jgi:hypothetical protein
VRSQRVHHALRQHRQAIPPPLAVAHHDLQPIEVEAYGELTVHVHSEYGSAKDEAQTKIRETLVSPYQAQADEERRMEQKARGKRKAGEPVDAAADATEKVEK